MGWDFGNLWAAGQAILQGIDPYSLPHFRYPLPMAYFMAIWALIPRDTAFILWGVLNFTLLVWAFRRDVWKWMLYFPVLHEFYLGENELLFWCIERVLQPGWRGAIMGAFMTLKPQTAFVLLSWHLWQWLRYDRVTFVRWLGCTILLWSLPLLWRPHWVSDWLLGRASESSGSEAWLFSFSNTTGIFSLLRFSYDLFIPLVIVACIVASWGLFFSKSKEIARACLFLANPIGLLYGQMQLMGTAPAYILVPLNLITVTIALLTQNFAVCMLVPIAVIVWNWWQQKNKDVATQQSLHNVPSSSQL